MRTNQEIGTGLNYLPVSGPILGGMAYLQSNVFLVRGSRKTMLIDTGTPEQAPDTVAAISRIIDPASLDYIFLTHIDIDHIGAVNELLALAPRARLVGSTTNMGKGTLYGLPAARFAVVWPGEEINLGNRLLTVEPSLIEDAHTYWLYDQATGTYFTSDAFGALHFNAPVDFAEDVPEEAFARGFAMWQTMNFNMITRVDQARFQAGLDAMLRRGPQQIASAHGPVIRQNVARAFDLMAPLPGAELPPRPALPPFLRLDMAA